MFKLKKAKEENINKNTITLRVAEATKPGAHEKTIISEGVVIKGNMNITGEVIIHGIIHGDIFTDNGIIQIINGGQIEGNISGYEIVVDGIVSGECHAEIIRIKENGCIDGKIFYQTLSVIQGGCFFGEAFKNEIKKRE